MFNTQIVGVQILCMLFTQETYDAYWLCNVSLHELKRSFYNTLIAATQIQKDW